MLLLAEAILLLHVCYAAFVIGGLLVVPLGVWLDWRWVRSPRFRIAHLLCTGVVAVEALIGVTCPLTRLEQGLLVAGGAPGYERPFIGQLLYRLLYYDAPMWVFTVAYTTFALIVIACFRYLPPLPSPPHQRP